MRARIALTGLAIALTAATVACNGGMDSRTARTTERFGTGRPATPAEIAAWDTDVNGAGEGLPAGRGTADQARHLYGLRCASCHGAQGEGGAGPQLVRPSVPPERPRRNVATHWPYAPPLFDYIRRTMPPDSPWTLTDDETYSLVALLLVDNGIVPAGYVVDAASLPRVRMPSRDRFVADDRAGGPDIK